ncbi:DNA polymerase III subunit chi [Neisseria chenwenguii]|uniref:DNA polymerase III subunit chi n=1 Tax=Neisseria chenwenguii TaxID=1853278 RepID=A0A220RZB0_9NEIS|nr:DNA polymerase III subunit chi [Neisseria chenwenguii]ASK26527.1 DNA polymerase III subunit chi [Neisseria chenwenguii]ROV55969.1 DNA polymerase III subunit chi [Neisseria chenwenguii]
MPKATFYTHVSNPAAFTCRLAARAIRGGGRVLVWSDSAAAVSALDRDLWQFDPESFIPHEIWANHAPMPSETPLLLASGYDLPTLPAEATVLNLSPDFWNQAPQAPARVLEIVGANFEELEEARNRFRAYRQSGFEIEHFNMAGKA